MQRIGIIGPGIRRIVERYSAAPIAGTSPDFPIVAAEMQCLGDWERGRSPFTTATSLTAPPFTGKEANLGIGR